MICRFIGAKLILTSSLLAGCGSGESSSTAPSANTDFPASLIAEFTNWTPVLDGDLAFASSGHVGQTVRVYFNDVAKPYFTGEATLPFAEGAMIAKAVLADANTASANASKVYFMRKKAAGFDTSNADWSYAEATGRAGSLAFSGSTGALAACYGCHGAEKNWDYVRTVDYFRNRAVTK